eukprot:3053821-Rhodomonas_salina.1
MPMLEEGAPSSLKALRTLINTTRKDFELAWHYWKNEQKSVANLCLQMAMQNALLAWRIIDSMPVPVPVPKTQ